MKKLLVVLIVVTALMLGCATPSDRFLTRVAINEVLIAKPGLAQPAYDLSTKLIEAIGTSGDIQLEDLKPLIESQINWEKVDPRRKLVLEELVLLIEDRIRERVELTGVTLPEDIKEQALLVLGWVKNTAKLHLNE